MSSILKVDTIQDQSGNNIINESGDTITIGASGDTIDVPGTEIKTNKVSPTSGTTLTLGDSGDAITIPSGATFAAPGVAVNGPAFSAYRTGTQTGIANNTYTKVQLNTEEFDTASAFDPTTNHRFTPLVAGYYQFSAGIVATGTNLAYTQAVLTKNGSPPTNTGSYTSTASSEGSSHVSALIYLNGSTDYVELFGYINITAGTGIFYGGGVPQAQSYLTGFLARVA